MTKKVSSLHYRPEIDGLRTIAVIPVILFHMSHSLMRGGYYGVDVFFIISGYLITKILTNNIENGNFSMYKFWIRRVKRLLPLLLTVVLTTLCISVLFVFKPVIKDISKDIFPAIFSYFNFHALYNFGDYWGGKSEQSFFLHTWSLSVEEQFYMIYPLFLVLIYKYFKNFIIPISIISVLSFVLFLFYLSADKDLAFYILPTRMWELTVGGLAGFVNLKAIKTIKYQKFLPIIGVLLISFSYLFGSTSINEIVILPVLGSVLIIVFCNQNDIVGKLLSTKLFVFIGKISYSLYLWHWVVIVLFKYNLKYLFEGTSKIFMALIIIIITFILSYLSYLFIENKTRNYKHTPKIVLFGFALISSLILYYQSDLFNPYYDSKYNGQTAYFSYYNIEPEPNKLNVNMPFYHNVSRPVRLDKFKSAYKQEGIITNNKDEKPKIMLLGDSHGTMWAKLLDEISEEIDITLSSYTASGNKPFFDIKKINEQEDTESFSKIQRIEYAKSIINNIEKWKPKIVTIVCRWESLKGNDKRRFNELLSFLENKRINVLLFTQPPVLKFMGNNNTAQYFTFLGINPVRGYNLVNIDNSSVIKANDYLNILSHKYNNIIIYDSYKHMILNDKVKISLDNNVLYYDDDHLSYLGTYEHKANILKLVNSIINNSQTK